MPVPPPTEPSSIGPGRAASSAASTSSSVTCRPSRSDSQPSQVSAATGSDQGKPPRSRPRVQRTMPACAVPTACVLVIATGSVSTPTSSIHVVPVISPLPLIDHQPAVDGRPGVRATVRVDRRDARAHRPLADHQRAVTPHQRAVSDLDRADVGDRVGRAGGATERHAEAAGAEASGRRLAVGVVRHDAAPLGVWREPTGGRGRQVRWLYSAARTRDDARAGPCPHRFTRGDETSAIPAADAPEGEPGDPERQAGQGRDATASRSQVTLPGRPPMRVYTARGHEEEEAPLAAGAPVDARRPPAARGRRRRRAVPVPQGRRRDHHEHERPEHPGGAGGSTWTPTATLLPGAPRVALVIGEDQRPGDVTWRSDTMMLVRLDPKTKTMSILSFPRDLMVDIPGYGRRPINDAFALGKERLALQTVNALTGIKPNYLVPVNFKGFEDIVDAFGPVWVEVDRRYYNKNLGTIEHGLRRDRPAAGLPAARRRAGPRLRPPPPHRLGHHARRPPAGVHLRVQEAPRRLDGGARHLPPDRHRQGQREDPRRGQGRRARHRHLPGVRQPADRGRATSTTCRSRRTRRPRIRRTSSRPRRTRCARRSTSSCTRTRPSPTGSTTPGRRQGHDAAGGAARRSSPRGPRASRSATAASRPIP